jgi:hypothetical protein
MDDRLYLSISKGEPHSDILISSQDAKIQYPIVEAKILQKP